jgi:hypothetical protein
VNFGGKKNIARKQHCSGGAPFVRHGRRGNAVQLKNCLQELKNPFLTFDKEKEMT